MTNIVKTQIKEHVICADKAHLMLCLNLVSNQERAMIIDLHAILKPGGVPIIIEHLHPVNDIGDHSINKYVDSFKIDNPNETIVAIMINYTVGKSTRPAIIFIISAGKDDNYIELKLVVDTKSLNNFKQTYLELIAKNILKEITQEDIDDLISTLGMYYDDLINDYRGSLGSLKELHDMPYKL